MLSAPSAPGAAGSNFYGRHRRHGRRRGHRHGVRCRADRRLCRLRDRRRRGRRRPVHPSRRPTTSTSSRSTTPSRSSSLGAPPPPHSAGAARRGPAGAQSSARRGCKGGRAFAHAQGRDIGSHSRVCCCAAQQTLGPLPLGPLPARTCRSDLSLGLPVAPVFACSMARTHARILCRGSGIRAVLASISLY